MKKRAAHPLLPEVIVDKTKSDDNVRLLALLLHTPKTKHYLTYLIVLPPMIQSGNLHIHDQPSPPFEHSAPLVFIFPILLTMTLFEPLQVDRQGHVCDSTFALALQNPCYMRKKSYFDISNSFIDLYSSSVALFFSVQWLQQM